uniref:Uncharacterized protein n=1 Tax=Anopheles atroparvus TaxID=41427 RepID=A0A182JJY6_ANOAO
MQSLAVLAFVLLSAVVLGSMAQYGGYAPKPVSYHQHAVRTPAPASGHGYGKADHSSCGALLLFDCAPEIVHAPRRLRGVNLHRSTEDTNKQHVGLVVSMDQ